MALIPASVFPLEFSLTILLNLRMVCVGKNAGSFPASCTLPRCLPAVKSRWTCVTDSHATSTGLAQPTSLQDLVTAKAGLWIGTEYFRHLSYFSALLLSVFELEEFVDAWTELEFFSFCRRCPLGSSCHSLPPPTSGLIAWGHSWEEKSWTATSVLVHESLTKEAACKEK